MVTTLLYIVLDGKRLYGKVSPPASGPVAFPPWSGMFTSLPGFPVTSPCNHNHPQLGGSTSYDSRVMKMSCVRHLGPHGGP
jgi:hypothetical protein